MLGGRKRLTSKDLDILIPIASVGLKKRSLSSRGGGRSVDQRLKATTTSSSHRLRGVGQGESTATTTGRSGTSTPTRPTTAAPTTATRTDRENEEREQLTRVTAQFKSTLSSIYSSKGDSGGRLSSQGGNRSVGGKVTSTSPLSRRPLVGSNRRPQSASVVRRGSKTTGSVVATESHLDQLNFNATRGTVKKLAVGERSPPPPRANSPDKSRGVEVDCRGVEVAPMQQQPAATQGGRGMTPLEGVASSSQSGHAGRIPVPPPPTMRPQSAPSSRIPMGSGIIQIPAPRGSMKGSSVRSSRPSSAHVTAPGGGGSSQRNDEGDVILDDGSYAAAQRQAEQDQRLALSTTTMETTTGKARVMKAVEISYGPVPKLNLVGASSLGLDNQAAASAGATTSAAAGGPSWDDSHNNPRTASQIAAETGFFGHYEHGSIREYLHRRLKKRFGAYGASVASNLDNLKEELGQRSPSNSPRVPTSKEFLYALQHPTQPLSVRAKQVRATDAAMSRLEQPPASRPPRPHSAAAFRSQSRSK